MSRTSWAFAVVAVVACRGPTESRVGPPVRSPARTSASPASDDEVRAYCTARSLPCRENVRVVLRRADGTVFERSFAIGPPALAGGILSLLPGETTHVEAEREGDALVLARVVAAPEHPERTLTFRFVQMEGKTDMLLTVQNPFDRPVKFDLGMMLPEGTEPIRVVRTSSCPVGPRIVLYEHWPHAIFQLFASRFRLLDPAAAAVCE